MYTPSQCLCGINTCSAELSMKFCYTSGPECKTCGIKLANGQAGRKADSVLCILGA